MTTNKNDDKKVCGEDTQKGEVSGPVQYESAASAQSPTRLNAQTLGSIPVAQLEEEGVPLTDLVRQVQDAEAAKSGESVGEILGYLKNTPTIEICPAQKLTRDAVAEKMQKGVETVLDGAEATAASLKQKVADLEIAVVVEQKRSSAYQGASTALKDKLAQYARMSAAAVNYLKELQASNPRLGMVTRELEDRNVKLASPQGLAYIVLTLADHAHTLLGANAELEAQKAEDLQYLGDKLDDILEAAKKRLEKIQE